MSTSNYPHLNLTVNYETVYQAQADTCTRDLPSETNLTIGIGSKIHSKYDSGKLWTPAQKNTAWVVSGIGIAALLALGISWATGFMVGVIAAPVIALGAIILYSCLKSYDLDNPKVRDQLAATIATMKTFSELYKFCSKNDFTEEHIIGYRLLSLSNQMTDKVMYAKFERLFTDYRTFQISHLAHNDGIQAEYNKITRGAREEHHDTVRGVGNRIVLVNAVADISHIGDEDNKRKANVVDNIALVNAIIGLFQWIFSSCQLSSKLEGPQNSRDQALEKAKIAFESVDKKFNDLYVRNFSHVSRTSTSASESVDHSPRRESYHPASAPAASAARVGHNDLETSEA